MESLLVFLCSITPVLAQESINVSLHWPIWFEILIGMIICFTCIIGFVVVVNILGWLTVKKRSPALNGSRAPYTYAVPMNAPRTQQTNYIINPQQTSYTPQQATYVVNK
jgi:hypothetical protein